MSTPNPPWHFIFDPDIPLDITLPRVVITPTSTLHTTTLNPNVYLNYLSPSTANQFEVARDLYLATLGALLWDMLISLPEDLALLKSGIRPTLFAYLLSRPTAFAFVLLSVIAKTNKLSHCLAFELGATMCWVISTGVSSCLLFQRLKAVYEKQKIVHYAFLIFLLVNMGMTTLLPIGSHAGQLANTGYCVHMGHKHSTAVAVFSRLIFDSFVFAAIAYKIATMPGVSGDTFSWKTLGSRKTTSRLMRGILQGGQQYYLLTVFSNFLVSVLIITHSVPHTYRVMLIVPDIALSSSMACRVYRNLKITMDKVDNAMSGVLLSKSVPGGGRAVVSGTSARLHSNASTVHRPPPEMRVASTSTAAISRLKDERYSIIKLKPFPSTRANEAVVATPGQSANQNYLPV